MRSCKTYIYIYIDDLIRRHPRATFLCARWGYVVLQYTLSNQNNAATDVFTMKLSFSLHSFARCYQICLRARFTSRYTCTFFFFFTWEEKDEERENCCMYIVYSFKLAWEKDDFLSFLIFCKCDSEY